MAQVQQAEFETCGSITKWSMRKDEAFRWAHWRKTPHETAQRSPVQCFPDAPSDDGKS